MFPKVGRLKSWVGDLSLYSHQTDLALLVWRVLGFTQLLPRSQPLVREPLSLLENSHRL